MSLRSLGLAALFLIGCEREGIESYRAPKDAPREVSQDPVEKAPEPTRLLGAILPQRDRVWFVKLEGPSADVEKERDRFVEFVRSIAFENSNPKWKLPEGWKEEPGTGFRFATFLIGDMEAVITPLGLEASVVLPNVNRWRAQIGLDSIEEPQLPKYVKSIETPAGKVTLVDLSSPENTPTASPSHQKLKYAVPEGWKEQPPQGMFLAAFKVEEVEVTVSIASGSLIDNVNRWRGQIGLAPVAADQLDSLVRSIDIAGAKASYVDLAGEKQRILAAVLPQGDRMFFFKMRGPADRVEKHKAAFEAFLRSVNFKS